MSRRRRQYICYAVVPRFWWRVKPFWEIDSYIQDLYRRRWLREHGMPSWGAAWLRRVRARERREGLRRARRFQAWLGPQAGEDRGDVGDARPAGDGVDDP